MEAFPLTIIYFIFEYAHGLQSPNIIPPQLLLENNIDPTREIMPGEFCKRECRPDGKPLRCYFYMVMEDYVTMGQACDFQPPPLHYSEPVTNSSCVYADGYERTFLAINRMFPGPPIQACVNDMIIVDVLNHYQGSAATIHWHGISQKDTPWSDGVPYVTQCPIPYANKYRYFFNLDTPGTYFYHGHLGLEKLNGQSGALIVREPKSSYVNQHLYKNDNHILMIHDWLHESPKEKFVGKRFGNIGFEPENLLINGRGIYIDSNGNETKVPLAHFYVEPNTGTRFRVVNAMATGCPVLLTFEKHSMIVIEKDGQPIEPYEVHSLKSLTGERFDLVIKANQNPGNYWIQLSCQNQELMQWGVLHYDPDSLEMPQTQRPSLAYPLPTGMVMNAHEGCNDTHVCLTQLVGISKDAQPELIEPENVVSHILTFQLHNLEPATVYEPNVFERFMVPGNIVPTIASVDGVSLHLPSSPLTTQYHDIDPAELCGDCPVNERPCKCAHVKKLPMNKVIELIFVDVRYIPVPLVHPMHVHGCFLEVLTCGTLSDLNITEYSEEAFRAADKAGLVKRNLDPKKRPVRVDTMTVPQNGYCVMRFFTDNPGFWFSHCHILTHLTTGMETIFQVGELDDMLYPPEGLPKCGNYTPSTLTGFTKTYREHKKGVELSKHEACIEYLRNDSLNYHPDEKIILFESIDLVEVKDPMDGSRNIQYFETNSDLSREGESKYKTGSENNDNSIKNIKRKNTSSETRTIEKKKQQNRS